MEMAILWLCVVQFPYTMVPHKENRAPFTGMMRRCGRLLLTVVLSLAGLAGFSQATSPPPYTIVATVVKDHSVDDGASLDSVYIQVFNSAGDSVGNVDVTVQINGSSNTTVIETGP